MKIVGLIVAAVLAVTALTACEPTYKPRHLAPDVATTPYAPNKPVKQWPAKPRIGGRK